MGNYGANKEEGGGGILVAWGQNIVIKQIRKIDFSLELIVENEAENETFWVTFVYASTEARERQVQWEELRRSRLHWGDSWLLGGDFNDIKTQEEKRGGRQMLESSFFDFRNFISDMEMGDLVLKGKISLWQTIENEKVISKRGWTDSLGRLNGYCNIRQLK